jgi:uncharacterized repeat protein (TIGR03803 family)
MSFRSSICSLRQLIPAALFFVLTAAFASAQVLYSFQPNTKRGDGANPPGALVVDSSGVFYGITSGGGKRGLGTVFELAPPTSAGGSWMEDTIYSFSGTTISGSDPRGTLYMDVQGNLYGTTFAGQPYGPAGYAQWSNGTAFELLHRSQFGAPWKAKLLNYFAYRPVATNGSFVSDGTSLYSTGSGGSGTAYETCSYNGCGTVVKLSPPAPGKSDWAAHVVRDFGTSLGDGVNPAVNLVMAKGVIYGTTIQGGKNGFGRVFELVENNGSWNGFTLHDLAFTEGQAPLGRLVIDSAGNIYGTAYVGGIANCQFGCGSVFKLSPPAVGGGSWQEATLYKFTGGADGGNPQGGVIFDSAGNLYGTASTAGTGFGTVYKLVPPQTTGGAWTEVTLHSFGGAPSDGSTPLAELIMVKGMLYGTSSRGGSEDAGAIFAVNPSPAGR